MKTLLLAASALFNSLDPHSVAQTLAYYELHPDNTQALERAMSLLGTNNVDDINVVAAALHSSELTEAHVQQIENLARHLSNRKLQGYHARTEADVLACPSEQIDLGMALLLSQLDGEPDAHFQARKYSASLDLMALQILAKLPKNATHLEKIQETNRFIFEQMHFRFPPHSVYAENIDLYTFLPSVMDNHLGVCLGVTAMYLAIAQRIDLPLEIVTPPGHIYVRYNDGTKIVNIETTARGIDTDSEAYLSLHTRELQVRPLKEVIGMTHVNQASTYLHARKYHKAVTAYEKAQPYMPDDPLVKELLGYSYIFTDKKTEGEALLKEIVDDEHSLAQDYLAGHVNPDGIAAVFTLVDENRESILAKQKELKSILKTYPNFRDGLHQLAVSWVQLNRAREAIDVLTRYTELDQSNATVYYYLSVLHGERHDFKNCWRHLKKAEQLTGDYHPKALTNLRRTLLTHCPE